MSEPAHRHPLPVFGPDLPTDTIMFAGDVEVQTHLKRQAQEMVEPYRLRPHLPW